MSLNQRYKDTLDYLAKEEAAIREDLADLREIYKRSTLSPNNVSAFSQRWLRLRLRQKDFNDDKVHMLRMMRQGDI